MVNTVFYSANEISKLLGVSRGQAYKIIKRLNNELEQRGYLTVAGKVSKKYFSEKYYGLTLEVIEAALS